MTGGIITQGLGTAILLTQGFATSVHGSGGVLQGGSPQLVPGAVFSSDSFTGTVGTALESHTPNSGGSWVANSANGGNQAVLDSANRVRNASIALVAYTISATPSSANQSVQADVVYLSRNIQSYDADVTARFSSTSITGYSAGYNPHGLAWHISRWNGGTQTALQTVSATLTTGNTYTANLVVQGSTLWLYVNGVLMIGPYTDTSPISATGNVGILLRTSGTIGDTDSTGAHLDNFVAQLADANVAMWVQYGPAASGGNAQGGSAGQTNSQHAVATGGTSLGGAKVFVTDTLVQASGGMASGGSFTYPSNWRVMPAGGLLQGGRAGQQGLNHCTTAGGSTQGGCGSVAQATALAANVHTSQGGAAMPGALSGAGGPITQGMATPWMILQGYTKAGWIVSPCGGTGQGGRANGASGQAYTPSPAGGMALGGSSSCQTSTEPASNGLITQGLRTGQVVTLGYLSWSPHAYTGATSGGIGGGGSAAAIAGHQLPANGGANLGGSNVALPIVYHIYMNSGQDDPIDYSTPVTTVAGLNWTSQALAVPGVYKLGVRAYNPLSGLEEQNVDAAVELVLDASGNDVTLVPPPPLGLRALPLAGGMVRVEWTSCCTDRSRLPLGFHLYLGRSGVPDYTTPVAAVAWSDQRLGCFTADLGNLTSGATYWIGVRAYNAVGEEANTMVLSVEADGSPPSVVDLLEAVATSQEA